MANRLGDFVIAAILSFAGWSKLYSQLVSADLAYPFDSFLFSQLLIFVELFLSYWLFTGIWLRVARMSALLMFAGFLAFLVLGNGLKEKSCGCFGDVFVSPQIMLFVDAACLALLVWLVRGDSARHGPKLVPAAVLAAMLATILFFCSPAKLRADLKGSTVALYPETWLNKRLPIIEYLEIPVDLENGDYQLFLYRSHCEVCQEALLKTHELNETYLGRDIVFVDIDPEPSDVSIIALGGLCGNLRGNAWACSTPIQLVVTNRIMTDFSRKFSTF